MLSEEADAAGDSKIAKSVQYGTVLHLY